MQKSWRGVVTVLAASLLLAACGATASTITPLVGEPSLNISVPLSVGGCDGVNVCYTVGTTGFSATPNAAGEVISHGATWHALIAPDASDTVLTASGCWRNGCLVGGSSALGDVVWLLEGVHVTVISGPSGGRGVEAISCYQTLTCDLVDIGTTGNVRFSSTTNGGTSWSTPLTVTTTPLVTVLAMSCDGATSCVITGTTGSETNLHAFSLSVNGATSTVSTMTMPPSWSQLTSVFCQPEHCVALAKTSDGVTTVVASIDGGATWLAQTKQPDHSPSAMACTTWRNCVAISDAPRSSGRLLVEQAGSWSDRTVHYIAGPLNSVGCGLTRCVVISNTTSVLTWL
jgi:hypothetical protein